MRSACVSRPARTQPRVGCVGGTRMAGWGCLAWSPGVGRAGERVHWGTAHVGWERRGCLALPRPGEHMGPRRLGN